VSAVGAWIRVHRAHPVPALHEKLLLWKRDGQLSALDFGGYETRHDSVLRLVQAADSVHALPDFGPILLHTGDRPINQGDRSWRSLAFAQAEGFEDIAVPDFLFDGWPQVGLGDYEQVCAAAARAGEQAAQTPRLGWIGNCDTSPVRWQLHQFGQRHPDLLDIHHVSWVPTPGSEQLSSAAGNHMTLEQQVRRWGLLIDLEGNGWSARLKLLLHSGRPVFMQERPWQEWFWPALAPMEHYIPVRRDLSDLVAQVTWALEHPEQASAIAGAGRAFAERRLTRAAALDAWAAILRRLAAQPVVPYAPHPVREALHPLLAQLGAPV